MGEDGDERVIGEGSVAMFAVMDVRDAAPAIALDGPWANHGDGGAADTVHDAGIDGDDGIRRWIRMHLVLECLPCARRD